MTFNSTGKTELQHLFWTWRESQKEVEMRAWQQKIEGMMQEMLARLPVATTVMAEPGEPEYHTE
jgi:hypothetical protein